MKVPPETIRIVSASPIVGTNNDKAYFRNVCVEFGSVATCQEVSRFTKNLPRDQRIMLHVAPVLKDRFRALSNLAYELRHQDPPYKTCIKYDSQSLVLLSRNPMEYRWIEVDTTHLPGPDMGLLASTPPPKVNTKRTRPSPTSSEKSVDAYVTKAPRINPVLDHPLSSPQIVPQLPVQTKRVSGTGFLHAATGVQDVGSFTDVQTSTPSAKMKPLVQQKLNFAGSSTTQSLLHPFGHKIDDSVNQGSINQGN